MKNALIVALVSLALTGCGKLDRAGASITGRPTKTCVDGVTSLQFTSGAHVQLDRAGKPVPC